MTQEADIRFRYNTAAGATSSNPLLNIGEPGFETDTGKFKIGDGSTYWTSLPYIGSISSIDWDDVTDKPTTFTPSAHTQATSTITGMNTPKRTILLSGAGGWASTTNGDAGFTQVEMTTNDVDVTGVLFESETVAKYHQWSLVMPDNYDGGTVTAKFYWTTNTTSPSGNISWKIQGRAFGDNDALDGAWGTAVEVVDTVIVQNDLHVSSVSSAVTIANTPVGGDMVQFRAYRDGADASDTSASDVILLGVVVKYGTDNYSDE